MSSQSTDHSAVELIEDAQTSQLRSQSDDQPAIELTEDAQISQFQRNEMAIMSSQSTDEFVLEPVQDAVASQRLKAMSGLSSQSTDQIITNVKAFQTMNKFVFGESKETKTHRYVTEKDTGRMFGRSLSHPCD